MPRLEILSRRSTGARRHPPLLFVHGAYCGAWIWDAKFLPWFAGRGWPAHAVSLRGHGGSEGRDRLNHHGRDDYVEDTVSAWDALAAEYGEPPVLIGHSMGGMMVQRALARRRAPAAVLMASAPPHGLLESTLGLAWRDPFVFQQMAVLVGLGTAHVNPEGVRRAMFSDRMPRAELALYEPLLQEESRRVLAEMSVWHPFPPRPGTDTPPVLVLGAERDLLFPPDQVRSTARHFATEAEFFPGMGHTMMLEPGWEQVAERIAAWVEAVTGGRRGPLTPPAHPAG